MKINFSNSRSKVQAVTEAISAAIMTEELRDGDNLLSINDASREYGVSRDTVFKAYSDLKRRGLIDSNPMKGYFVKSEVTHVLLLLDTYSPFKQNLYNRFVAQLPENYKVDLIFHQYNERLFETIVKDSLVRYNMFVVMNFSNIQFSSALRSIPAGKLLLLDFGDFEKNGYSYICQNFDQSFYDALMVLEPSLRSYRQLSLVFPPQISHPESAVDYFQRFCSDNHFECKVYKNDRTGIEKYTCYVCIDSGDLVKIIKEADALGWEIGREIGVVAYNDNPILEVIKNGITAISVDFGLMGEMAAAYVLNKKPVQKFLPTNVILRKSV